MDKITTLKENVGNRIRIFFLNGYQQVGILNAVEDDYILFKDEKTGRENIILKHAISTIVV